MGESIASTATEVVVRYLEEAGVSFLFGYPGTTNIE